MRIQLNFCLKLLWLNTSVYTFQNETWKKNIIIFLHGYLIIIINFLVIPDSALNYGKMFDFPKPWGSLVNEELLACQIPSQFNQKKGCFVIQSFYLNKQSSLLLNGYWGRLVASQ